MNPTIDLLLRRKSVRAYADRPIPPEVRAQLLEATLRAPTAGNMMLYTILEVGDQRLKDRLAVTCDNQPFIARAPLVWLFLADYQRWYDYYLASGVEALCRQRDLPLRRPEEGDLLLACCDALIAAQTAVVAAESLGLGSCYIGDILEQFETHRALFGLPQYALPICMLCFGYPSEGQKNRPQTTRFDQQYILFENQYRRLSPQELEAMFQAENARRPAGADPSAPANAGQANYLRKFSAGFSIEMSRSVRAMLKAWTGD